MIVNHEYGFIFLKTTKTAGTSIEIALSGHCGPRDVITLLSDEDETVRRELGFRGPQNYVVPFSSYGVRDWAYLARFGRRRHYSQHTPAAHARRWVGAGCWREYFVFCFERNPYDKAISRYYWSTRDSQRPAMNDFLRTASEPQLSNWQIYTIRNRIAVDFVGRYEHLEQDLTAIWKRLNIPGDPVLPRAKGRYRVDRRHYSRSMDNEAQSIIARACAREIAAFEYEFEYE